MKAFLLRLLISFAAVILAVVVVPGISFKSINTALLSTVVLMLVIGISNALLKPVLTAISCGCNVLSLGLFFLVVDTLIILLAGWLDIGLQVDGFWPAFWAGLIIAVSSFFSNMMFSDAFM